MKTFTIKSPDRAMKEDIRFYINDLTKPLGSLGRLEELALQISLIQQTIHPKLNNPCHIIFAADHGIADEGVSFSPKEVTQEMVKNFLAGGAGINFLARQHHFDITVLDGGIDADFQETEGLIIRKVRKGTRNFLYEAALTQDEFDQCIEIGAQACDDCYKKGCNIISFGEMGIGNTSPSSMWLHIITGISLPECVGAGSGLAEEGVRHKIEVLQKAYNNYHGDGSILDKIRYFGGIELVMTVGAMLRAAELGMIILVDGFIMTASALVACYLYPESKDYMIFSHEGEERGHQLMLKYLGVKGLINLGLRLGEGSGAICAYPIVDSAVRMINEMSTFSQASVTKYF